MTNLTDWLDETPYGEAFRDIQPLTPLEIDSLRLRDHNKDLDVRIWATLRVAMTQAYAEGFNEGFKAQQEIPL